MQFQLNLFDSIACAHLASCSCVIRSQGGWGFLFICVAWELLGSNSTASFLQYLFFRIINLSKQPAHFLDLSRLQKVFFFPWKALSFSFSLAVSCNTPKDKKDSRIYQSMLKYLSSEMKKRQTTPLEVADLLLLKVHLCTGLYQGKQETHLLEERACW